MHEYIAPFWVTKKRALVWIEGKLSSNHVNVYTYFIITIVLLRFRGNNLPLDSYETYENDIWL